MHLLDNEQPGVLTVREWIEQYTTDGTMDIVTGYFTVGALAWLSRQATGEISAYRFILGDIVSRETSSKSAINLLNETLHIDGVLKLAQTAREAVDFLQLDIVSLKTLEPNFCHAKLYLGKSTTVQSQYYITGSSNLTDAGIGKNKSGNVELNTAASGGGMMYNALCKWFDELWMRPQAHDEKTVLNAKGEEVKVPFKKYLIDQIGKIFREYSPKEIYYKILFELFGKFILEDLENPEFNRQIGKLQNTEIFKACYPFQQQGIIGVIRMLEKYRGAILADAVGLGKTWSALAIMKFYQLKGYEVVLISPKKLEHNWKQYRKNKGSRFEADHLEYAVRFHTDLTERLMRRKQSVRDVMFRDNRQRLFVIDESHNLRNDKSARYKFLVEEVLSHNENSRVLLLSATPINNSLNDVRNQFRLLVQGRNDGFAETLDVRNIDGTFKSASREFKLWAESSRPHISTLIPKLPDNFLKLTDALLLPRTRKMIAGMQDSLVFPKRGKPENLFVTPRYIGNYESFDELFNDFPPILSGYQPARYTRQAANVKRTEDEQQRQYFLARMMYVLMVKRLESSWIAFQKTISKIAAHHQTALDRILAYEKGQRDKAEMPVDIQASLFSESGDEALEQEWERLSLGKSNPISLKEIDHAGMLEAYKHDLKLDIAAFSKLKSNLHLFQQKVNEEADGKTPRKSVDTKLEKLIDLIRKKQKSGANRSNQKVLVFTVYADTAIYLYDELTHRGMGAVAMVSGDSAISDEGTLNAKGIEDILERFSPYTKLFREKRWDGFTPSTEDLPIPEQFEEWKIWLRAAHPREAEKLDNPIDILIATDVLSEGQNLQDCDMVVNYDIHWNPVRIIQRMGRVDRLGSPNDTIYGINFWPSDNIDTYLNLRSRIEQRMAAMKLVGAEVDPHFTDEFRRMTEDEDLEARQAARMMQHMQYTWDDIEENEEGLGFENLSLESFRQDLAAELDKDKDKYRQMPNGVFSGFVTLADVSAPSGLIALLRYERANGTADHDLIFIDENGLPLANNQKEVLDLLARHKEQLRDDKGLGDIDKGEANAIAKWSRAMHTWMKAQAVSEMADDEGNVTQTAGSAQVSLMKQLQGTGSKPVEEVKAGSAAFNRYAPENLKLIVWMLVRAAADLV